MEKSDQENLKIPAFRTYAQDLEYTRSHKNLPRQLKTEVVSLPKKLKTFEEAFPKESEKTYSFTKKEFPSRKNNTPFKKAPVIHENADSQASTIITDTKKNRFKLFPAIIASIEGWFNKKKGAGVAKSVPKYGVPESSRRKGVVQKATSTTAKSISADFSSIQQRIKNRKETLPEHKIRTSWSPNTEPGFLLLEDGTKEPARINNVVFEPRKSVITNTEDIRFLEELEVETEEAELEDKLETYKTQAASVASYKSSGEELKEVETEAKDDEYETQEKIEEYEDSEDILETKNLNPNLSEVDEDEEILGDGHITLKERFAILKIDTNILSIFVAGVILLLGILIFTIIFFIGRNSGPEVQALDTLPISLLINTKTEIITLKQINQTSVSDVIKNNSINFSEIYQFGFVRNLQPLEIFSAREIIEGLDLSLQNNFLQTIENIRFGYTEIDDSFILIKIQDPILAKGGLLEWEQSLYEDFVKIYNLAPVAQSTGFEFEDSSFSGHDVRILKSTSGEELLLYGILGNIVIISSNSVNFRKLSILVR